MKSHARLLRVAVAPRPTASAAHTRRVHRHVCARPLLASAIVDSEREARNRACCHGRDSDSPLKPGSKSTRFRMYFTLAVRAPQLAAQEANTGVKMHAEYPAMTCVHTRGGVRPAACYAHAPRSPAHVPHTSDPTRAWACVEPSRFASYRRISRSGSLSIVPAYTASTLPSALQNAHHSAKRRADTCRDF